MSGKPLVEYVEKIASTYSTGDMKASSAIVLGCGTGLTSHLLTTTFSQVCNHEHVLFNMSCVCECKNLCMRALMCVLCTDRRSGFLW